METPASKSQLRTLSVYSLGRTDGTYLHAASLLQAAGLPATGMPANMTPQAMKKLTDAELRNLLGEPRGTGAAVKTSDEVRADQRADFVQRRQEFNERTMAPYAPREEPEYLDNLQPRTTPTTRIVDSNDNLDTKGE